MDIKKQRLVLAALVHDVGKIVYRTGAGKINHSTLGADFLEPYFRDDNNKKEILKAVRHHHLKDIEKLNTSSDDISYIVYEADNIASATDRRKNEDGSMGFTIDTPLESVFNSLQQICPLDDNAKTGKRVFKLQGLMEDDTLQYPTLTTNITADRSKYIQLLNTLESHLRQCSLDNMKINELLQIIEGVASYIPSSTASGEIADISLYDHQKLTAALAACMYDYFQENQLEDYRSYCYKGEVSKYRANMMYLLAGGKLHGIKEFIYNIPSKGAMRSLRGRSFYVDILLEHIIDELLNSLELSRCNLLFSGGGTFNLLLPNTDKAKKLLKRWQAQINKWLLNNFGSQLYFSVGKSECSAANFKIENNSASNKAMNDVYRELRISMNDDNKNRYTASLLQELFSPDSSINNNGDGEKECCICHKSSLNLYPYGESYACGNCSNLYKLGKELLNNDVIAVFKTENLLDSEKAVLSLPMYDSEEIYYLQVFSEKEAEEKAVKAERLYVKNKLLVGNTTSTRLWMADYAAADNAGNVYELGELATLSGGEKDENAIKRLGVMKADIDDLQLAVLAGFPHNLATFGRIAVFSRQIEMFFKRYINGICFGQITAAGEPGSKQFTLFDVQKDKKRKIHVIYAGNGSVLLAGAWDDVFEIAVDMKKAFSRFTNGKMSFSAGIGLYNPSCPITEIIRSTDDLNKYAKLSNGKDSITMFGSSVSGKGIYDNDYVRYKWANFILGVYKDKLQFIQKNIDITDTDSTKLKMGKGILYKLLELLRNSDEKINLARFAYALARLEPDKNNVLLYEKYVSIRNTFYQWYKNKVDRKQLATAIELMVYKVRQKGV